jgi:hypothetical protein
VCVGPLLLSPTKPASEPSCRALVLDQSFLVNLTKGLVSLTKALVSADHEAGQLDQGPGQR